MHETELDESADERPLSRRIRWIIRLGLLGLVAYAPWAFAGVWAACQLGLLAVVVLLLVLDIVYETTIRRRTYEIPVAWIPVLLGLLLGTLQLAPLPGSLQAPLAPEAHRLRTELLDDLPADDGLSVPHFTSRSIYRAATREQLALLTLAMSVFYLATRHGSQREILPWLLGGVTVLGVALALFGLVQKLAGNGKLYWVWETTYGATSLGPFVNRNSGAGYLNLCLAAAVGWLIWVTRHRMQSHSSAADHFPDSSAAGGHRLGRPASRLGDYLRELEGSGLSIIGCMALMACAIVVSLSRGGTLSLVAGSLATGGLLVLRGGGRRHLIPLLVALLAGVFVLGWVGQTQTVADRLATLFGEEAAQNGRWVHWADAGQTATRFLTWGSGLGTYAYAYAMAQDWFSREGVFYYAENVFVQALVEGGLIALSLLLSTITLVAVAVQRLAKVDRPTAAALAATGTYALISQIVSGSFDFGLYMPANAVLMALLCGAVVGRALRTLAKMRASRRWVALPASAAVSLALAGLLTVAAVAGAVEMWRAAMVERAWYAAAFPEIRLEQNPALLRFWHRLWTDALHARPDDYRTHQHLAELQLQDLRLSSLARLQAQTPTTDPEELWDRTELFQLHEAASRLEREGTSEQLLRLRLLVAPQIDPAWKHMLLARQDCPVLAHLHYSLAEMAPIKGAPGGDMRHLERATELAPGDATLWYWVGVLHWNAERRERAVHSWTAAARLTDTYDQQIAARVLERMDVGVLIEEILAARPLRLLAVAEQQFAGDEPPEQVEQQRRLLREVIRLLDLLPSLTAEQQYAAAQAHRLLGHSELALALYKQAVQRNAAESTWRYEYAQLLLEQGLLDAAYEQSRILIQNPRDRRARLYTRLHEQITAARVRRP